MQLKLEHIHFQGAVSARRPRVVPTIRSGARIATGDGVHSSEFAAVQNDDDKPLPAALAWVVQQFGLTPESYRRRALNRRLAACQRQVGVRSPEEIRARLEREPALLGPALDALLIGVTEFFRDTAVFERVRYEVLPEILRRRSAVRVYAPGVSSGEELYSVAMLLAESGALARSELTGVDCRPEAIVRARAGVFAPEQLAGVPSAWREKYFAPTPTGDWRAVPELRDRMRWVAGDMFNFTLPAQPDLILFRNVAIYFSAQSAERAWATLVRQLMPGGWLVTGRAEKPPAHAPLVRVAPSIYRKHLL